VSRARRGTRSGAIVVAILIGGLAGGCTTTLGPELMVPTAPAAAVRRTEWTITVAPVTSEGKPNTVALELTDQFRIGNEQFQAALVKALVASGIFRSLADTGEGTYELQAHIVSQQSQRTGFLAASSSLVVNYRLREMARDREVWHDTIISEDAAEGAPFSEGVPGAAKKSLAGAARRNVAEMLEKLSEKIP
jgi:hypothetical protein